MCEFFVKADPIQYEQRSRTVRIHGVLTRDRKSTRLNSSH